MPQNYSSYNKSCHALLSDMDDLGSCWWLLSRTLGPDISFSVGALNMFLFSMMSQQFRSEARKMCRGICSCSCLFCRKRRKSQNLKEIQSNKCSSSPNIFRPKISKSVIWIRWRIKLSCTICHGVMYESLFPLVKLYELTFAWELARNKPERLEPERFEADFHRCFS